MFRDIHLSSRAIFSTLNIYIPPFFAAAIVFAFTLFAVAITFAIAAAETMYFGAMVYKLHASIYANPEPRYSSPFRLEVESLNQELTQLSSNQRTLDPSNDNADIVLPFLKDCIHNKCTKAEAVQILL